MDITHYGRRPENLRNRIIVRLISVTINYGLLIGTLIDTNQNLWHMQPNLDRIDGFVLTSSLQFRLCNRYLQFYSLVRRNNGRELLDEFLMLAEVKNK